MVHNRTYQFLAFLRNLRNFTAQATGFVFVRVEDTERQMVAIK